MSAHHSHGSASERHERALWVALIPTAGFMVAEIVGGVLTGSLALISDASHMATDVFGIAIAIAAIRIGRRPADLRRTFGYERFEILAAALNAILLFGVAAYILVEAYRRLSAPPEIQSTSMLVIAVIGLVVNFLAMRILSEAQGESLNLKGAYLEVWSDLLGSIGVIAAALMIRFTGLTWIDSLVAIGIGLWVLPRTWSLFSNALNVLLEGVPQGLDVEEIRVAMTEVSGVTDIHDLHVWSLTGGRVCLTAHMVAPSRAADQDILLEEMNRMLRDRFKIGHVTLQYERVPCPDAMAGHRFL
ncbi:cation diffusion facilitator family transporter [Microvirga mediterraneensis]|jgi:cobalt-zinc-cadmium efflux system protein|uniref:Cation transporter n=1 Tax=Microvirga mediterraneensis TaxID=2754695 RepID=A0A838BVG3_9HYPH|nr:cation diffusion facilitator family transporter [Microvirga mediterraneensis]MBA1158875.1 cation transporter [Microvirga mediterraneensis]